MTWQINLNVFGHFWWFILRKCLNEIIFKQKTHSIHSFTKIFIWTINSRRDYQLVTSGYYLKNPDSRSTILSYKPSVTNFRQHIMLKCNYPANENAWIGLSLIIWKFVLTNCAWKPADCIPVFASSKFTFNWKK